jgi:hypothetical protein
MDPPPPLNAFKQIKPRHRVKVRRAKVDETQTVYAKGINQTGLDPQHEKGNSTQGKSSNRRD